MMWGLIDLVVVHCCGPCSKAGVSYWVRRRGQCGIEGSPNSPGWVFPAFQPQFDWQIPRWWFSRHRITLFGDLGSVCPRFAKLLLHRSCCFCRLSSPYHSRKIIEHMGPICRFVSYAQGFCILSFLCHHQPMVVYVCRCAPNRSIPNPFDCAWHRADKHPIRNSTWFHFG